MSELDNIKARAEAATPGPWKVWGMQVLADPVGDSNLDTALPIADTTDPHRGMRTFNAGFICAARTDVPKLVAALEAVDEVCAHWDEKAIEAEAGFERGFLIGAAHILRLKITEALA